MLRAQAAGSDVASVGDRLDDAGIVDQDVEAAEPLPRGGHRALDRGIVGDVAGQRLGAAAGGQISRATVCARSPSRASSMTAAPSRASAAGRAFAQAAARAGHQGDFSVELIDLPRYSPP